MVHRMIKRGSLLAPFIIVGFALFGGWSWAASSAVGVAAGLANLWLSGRVIGGVAENSPQMLMPAALGVFTAGLLALTLLAVGLKRIDFFEFAVTGVTLIAIHLAVVVWEAAATFLKLPDRSASNDKELVHGA